MWRKLGKWYEKEERIGILWQTDEVQAVAEKRRFT